MSINHAISISSLNLANIISHTQSIIRTNQITSALLPLKCQQSTMQMFAQPFNANFGASDNVKPFISTMKKIQKNLKIDNFSISKCKMQKNTNDNINQQIQQNMKKNMKQKSLTGKFTRNLSNKNSEKRGLLTTSNTTRIKDKKMLINFNNFINKDNYSQCQNQFQSHQICDIKRKNTIRTAAITSRTQKKYVQIDYKINSVRNKNIQNQQKDSQIINQEQIKRKQFFEKLDKQKYEKNISDNLQHKLSIYRRSLNCQLQQAKIGQTQPYKITKATQPIQIISYESLQNGNLLTNRARKPLRKNIQNIINLKYQQGKYDKFIKKKSNQQASPCKKHNHAAYNPQHSENEQDSVNQFHTINLNYNNSGRRQLSLIPYLTINHGVRISEKSLQVTICKNQPPQNISRQTFIKSSQGFRSFSYKKPEQNTLQKNKFMTIDVNRGNHKVTKSSVHNQAKNSFGDSLLWRPKTSRQANKIKLINEQYARQMMTSLA